MLYPVSPSHSVALGRAGCQAPPTVDYMSQQFDTVGVLGSGFSSTCIHVVSRLNGRPYAIKRNKKEYLGFNDRQLKLREVETMSLLMSRRTDVGSGNVVSLHAAWEQAGILYMQLEYLSLGALDSYLENCNFDLDINVDSVGCIVGDVLLGLGFIHSLDIVHLDLKPANILISQLLPGSDFSFSNLRFKIGDFGMAIRSSGDSEHWQLDKGAVEEGDRIYMPPEILQNIYGKHCDVFSFGLMLVEIISNCSLPDQGDVWTKLRQGNFDDVPQVRVEFSSLSNIIYSDLLQPDFRRRSTINELLLHSVLAPMVFSRMWAPAEPE